MCSDILVTEDLNLEILREIGFVSTTDAPSRDEAIATLKREVKRLGCNTLVLVHVGKAVSDPHFPTDVYYAHGVAVDT